MIDAPKMHIGLGSAKQTDSIRVIWTDGIPQNITQSNLLRSRIGVLAPQILIGSCPYIYTWNGERFEFFSDCLWAAPIGLVQANGDFAPTREWEYLKIPGHMLQPDEERYRLQLTEELWEAAYFDEIRLTAVDHPAHVDIFSNEKVGSPAMAAPRIHTVANPRSPISVVDASGRDLLPGLRQQDQNYVQAFSRRIVQGLTDEWVMEFDFGAIEPGEQGQLEDDVVPLSLDAPVFYGDLAEEPYGHTYEYDGQPPVVGKGCGHREQDGHATLGLARSADEHGRKLGHDDGEQDDHHRKTDDKHKDRVNAGRNQEVLHFARHLEEVAQLREYAREGACLFTRLDDAGVHARKNTAAIALQI